MMPKKVFTLAADEDRISKLPDGVLGNILSRLDTKNAVATCILSKDWKDKWLCIYNIDINSDHYNLREEVLPSFVYCLGKLLQRGIDVTTIYFRPGFSCFPARNLLEFLISGFLKYKAEILHINAQRTVVPGGLLSRETLRELVLENSSFKVPAEICFPHLKTLCLQDLEISFGETETSNEIHNTTTLKFTFPVLETFQLFHCMWPKGKLIEIYAPSLKKLESNARMYFEASRDYEIKIFGATGPVTYISEEDELDNVVFIGSNIVSAVILGSYYIDESVNYDAIYKAKIIAKNLLRECLSTVADLKLSADIFRFFAEALMEIKHGYPVPIFSKLERLSLACLADTEPLFEFLHAAPVLKSLAIEVKYSGWDRYDYDAEDSLPSCLLSTLEEIELVITNNELDDYTDFACQVRLLKFLLKIGERAQLKRFDCQMRVLANGGNVNSDELMENISSLPRAPPHFTVRATKFSSGELIKRFRCSESSGWVEDV